MTIQELKRLEGKAMDQTGKFLATPIAITPGTLLELCRLARIGLSDSPANSGDHP